MDNKNTKEKQVNYMYFPFDYGGIKNDITQFLTAFSPILPFWRNFHLLFVPADIISGLLMRFAVYFIIDRRELKKKHMYMNLYLVSSV